MRALTSHRPLVMLGLALAALAGPAMLAAQAPPPPPPPGQSADEDREANRRQPRRGEDFTPSEDISEDASVAFPVDI